MKDEDNNLIITGAGSGKTTTIVGKVHYILNRYNVAPQEILIISFTKKSASSLSDRIKVDGLEPKTFYKFGKDLHSQVDTKQPSTFDDAQFKNLILGYFKDLCKDSKFLSKVTTYFANYLKPEKAQDEFETHGAYIQYLKDQNFTSYTLREVNYIGKITYKREVVKSIEECKIANFLLFNGVDYEYESPYEFDTATTEHQQYKPDFTLNPKGQRIYFEHFGIDKSGNVPRFFANIQNGVSHEQASAKYNDSNTWKRELHKNNGTILLETYSYQMSEETLFEELENSLTGAGLTLKPMSAEDMWDIISESAKDEVGDFINLFRTFIMLMKPNNYSIKDLEKRIEKTNNIFDKKRNELF